jgi:hypothetical protein
MLCEINASSVIPFPPEAVPLLARATTQAVAAVRARRLQTLLTGRVRAYGQVAHGIRITAGVVTSAAIIMVAVFAVFGTLSLQQFKQLSVGLAVAVLLDAMVVRGVLLPSAMALLGDRNWYLPRWLSWLPPRRRRRHQVRPVPAPGPPSRRFLAMLSSHSTIPCQALGPRPGAQQHRTLHHQPARRREEHAQQPRHGAICPATAAGPADERPPVKMFPAR